MALLKPSEVNTQLDEVSKEIANIRKFLHASRIGVSDKCVNLGDIPNKYADLLETVNAVSYGGINAFELANKAQLAALTAEFGPLLTRAQGVRDYMNLNTTEF